MAPEITPDPTSEEVAAIMAAIAAARAGRTDAGEPTPVDRWRVAGRLAAVGAGDRVPRNAPRDPWVASGRR